MEKKSREYRSYSEDFKLGVLRDYYSSGMSRYFIAKKYGILSSYTISKWERHYPIDSKLLSLSSEVLKRAIMKMPKKKEEKTREEKLEEKIRNLQKALAYSELRNEALNELINVAEKQEGIQIRKKAGAKQH